MDISTADAIIDGALLDAQSGGKAISGPSDNPTLLPSGQTKDAPAPEETDEEKQVRQAKEDMLGKEEADRLAEEEAAQKAKEATLLGAAEKLLNRGKSTAQGANIKLGNVPTPGNVGFPLVLLAIFFFILITYNGNTRFQWLWKVLSNNAYISGSQGASTQSNSSTGSANSSGPGAIPAISALDIPLPKISSNGMGGNPYS